MHQTSNAPTPLAVDERDELRELLQKYGAILRKFWPWLLLSVLLALSLGYLFYQTRDRLYTATTIVLVEEAEDYSSLRPLRGRRGQTNGLLQLGGVSAGDNLDNEMFILSSLRLMERVVERLHLTTSLTQAQSLHHIALYDQAPFQLLFSRPTKHYGRCQATIEPDGRVLLTDFESETPLSAAQKKLRIFLRPGHSANTPLGRLRLEAKAPFSTFPRQRPITLHRYSLQQAARIYQSRLKATEHSKYSTLINLTLTDIHPQRAEDILRTLCEVYKQDIVDNKNRVAQSTARFIDERIALISEELSQVEQRQATYKEQHHIVDIRHTAERIGQLGSAARQRAQEAATQLSVSQWLVQHLQQSTQPYELLPSLTALPNSGVTQQINEYNRLALERSRLLANSSEQNPQVRELSRQLTHLRATLQAALSHHVKSLQIEAAAAQREEQRLSAQSHGLPAKERIIADIARQQGLKENLYNYLLNKREEVALQLAIEEANVRIVEPPIASARPVAPRRSLFLLVALGVGIALPLFLLWLRELLDTTLSHRADIEAHCDIPILGELPRAEKATDSTLLFHPSASPHAPAAEAFRLLRHSLQFVQRDARVIMVTSTIPGQGKSFVSRNLAGALAATGKKVLLIDADIRLRNLSRHFAPHRHQGLTEWIIEAVPQIADLILTDALSSGVDFLPAGATPPNAAELLMSPRLDLLIEQLLSRYDYLLLDTTPCFSVADANILARLAHLTLMVLRVGRQPKAAIPALQTLYNSGKLGHLALLINDCDIKAKTYGYGYGYGYGYQAPTPKRWWKRQ